MFRTRLFSGIVLVVLALIFIIHGGALLLVVLGIVSLIGLYELYRVFNVERSVGIAGYAACVVFYLNMWFQFLPDVMMMILLFLIVCMCFFVFGYPRFQFSQIIGVFFGFFYVAVMLSCVYLTRNIAGGTYLVWLIFISAWGCDTCAYCGGMLFGKHKMTPKLSPKKTVEGAIGGVVGAFLLAIIYWLIFHYWMGTDWKYMLLMAVVCAAGALVAMLGDLAASAIKRQYDVKDFGRLIPGHGGIMDRFDSVIFVAPVIYLLSLYIIVR